MGRHVIDEWEVTASIRKEIVLDAFVMMPDHVHGILMIQGVDVGAHGRAPEPDLATGYRAQSRALIVDTATQRRAHGRPREMDSAMEQRAHSRAPLRRTPRSLGSFVAGFKSSVTKHVNFLRDTPGAPVWQRNYYEHIIRDEDGLSRARDYIVNNPLRCSLDHDHSQQLRVGAHGRAPGWLQRL